MYESVYESPIGRILIKADENAVVYLGFDAAGRGSAKGNAVTDLCGSELDRYFKGNLREFAVPVSLSGTAFRLKAWDELKKIPYGCTISYKELAERLGNVKAVRAVGGANHHNPVSIIVPCHRVIGADGSLTGYGGGLWRKEWLLEHEKRYM